MSGQFRCAYLKIIIPLSQAESFLRRFWELVTKKALKYMVGSGRSTASRRPTVELHVLAQAHEKFSKKKFLELLLPIQPRHVKLVQCKPGPFRNEAFLACKGTEDACFPFEYGSRGRGFVSSGIHDASAEVSDALPSFLCPISHSIMNDPVMLVESCHSYERSCITEWLRNHSTGNGIFNFYKSIFANTIPQIP